MVDESSVVFDAENPEWTEADFARARPGAEVLPAEVIAAFGGRRGRPAVPEPKRVVTLRLPPSLIAAYEAAGKDWRARMEAVLASGVTAGTIEKT